MYLPKMRFGSFAAAATSAGIAFAFAIAADAPIPLPLAGLGVTACWIWVLSTFEIVPVPAVVDPTVDEGGVTIKVGSIAGPVRVTSGFPAPVASWVVEIPVLSFLP